MSVIPADRSSARSAISESYNEDRNVEKNSFPFLFLRSDLGGRRPICPSIGRLGTPLIHSRKVVLVPELSGKSVNDALNILGPLGLGLEKEGETKFDKRFPAGTIVRQTPAAAMSVREGRIVRVTVSQGGETLFVPNLVGQPLRNTQTSLQNLGLNVGEDRSSAVS